MSHFTVMSVSPEAAAVFFSLAEQCTRNPVTGRVLVLLPSSDGKRPRRLQPLNVVLRFLLGLKSFVQGNGVEMPRNEQTSMFVVNLWI